MSEEKEANGRRRRGRPRTVPLLLLGVLVALSLLFFLIRRGQGPPVAREEEAAAEGKHVRSALLYFAAAGDGRLVGERRELLLEGSSREDFVRRLVGELARGPLRADARPTVPPGLAARSVFFDDAGEVYVDLDGEGLAGWSWGTAAEIVAIGSLVRTLAGALPEVFRVRLLVDGRSVETIGGHVDALHPFEVAEWR